MLHLSKGEWPICLMGRGIIDLQGPCSGDLFPNTLSYILEEEVREGKREKDHEYTHEGVLFHSHVHSAMALRLSHTSTPQGRGKSLLCILLLRKRSPGWQQQSMLVFLNNKFRKNKAEIKQNPIVPELT